MSAFNTFLVKRMVAIPITLFFITLALYSIIMLAPFESRVQLYMPKSGIRSQEIYERIRARTIQKYSLDKSFPIQYFIWLKSIFSGNWGYSPVLQNDVLPELIRRTPVTLELVLYCLILQIPMGLLSGVKAAQKKEGFVDFVFRISAFIATSLPDFILAILLMAIFYIGLGWFAPERLSVSNHLFVRTDAFQTYTGLLTIDAFINHKPEIALDALRHLAMPVFTLSIVHWATLGRVTRSIMIEELDKDYVTAARARGLPEKRVIWNHAFTNTLGPALNSSALSAATLVTGVFIVESIFNINGVTEILTKSGAFVPDAAAVLGFSIYNVFLVLSLMFVLDILNAIFVPSTREDIMSNAD